MKVTVCDHKHQFAWRSAPGVPRGLAPLLATWCRAWRRYRQRDTLEEEARTLAAAFRARAGDAPRAVTITVPAFTLRRAALLLDGLARLSESRG